MNYKQVKMLIKYLNPNVNCYISIFFSKLVGGSGSVIVFEPGTNNLAYIKKNIRSDKFKNVRLRPELRGFLYLFVM